MKTRKIIDKILGSLVVIIMAVLVLDVLWQVASRYLVKQPSSFTDELAGFLLIWVGLFGAAYATGKKQHLAINILSRKLKEGYRKNLENIINTLVGLFALIVLIIGGSNLVFITLKLNQISSALEIPLGYVYLVLPLSGAFILFYAVNEMIYGVPEDINT